MADSEISGTAATLDKGKEKEAPAEDVETSDEEDESAEQDSEELDDDLNVLDVKNILGSRTRGKQIDYEKAAAELQKEQTGDEDEEDDDDYIAQEETTNDDMEIDG